jgi:hypothetical protein
MSVAPKLVSHGMTVSEFIQWPGDGSRHAFQLVDGEPCAMAPASITHGILQTTLGRLLEAHLIANRPGCRVVTGPGVIPKLRADTNFRIPDLGVTCSPLDAGEMWLPDPVLVIEILSPSNRNETRANVGASPQSRPFARSSSSIPRPWWSNCSVGEPTVDGLSARKSSAMATYSCWTASATGVRLQTSIRAPA